MSERVALVTGASSGIGESTARQAPGGRLRDVRRRSPCRPHVRARGGRRAHLRHGRHQRRLDGGRDGADPQRAGPPRRPGEQRGLRLLRRGRGRPDRRGAAPVRGQRLRLGPAGPARGPHMREQKSGRIINISSIGGKFYEPLGAWYHATKFAVEGFSDSLRLELARSVSTSSSSSPARSSPSGTPSRATAWSRPAAVAPTRRHSFRVFKTMERGDTGWAGTDRPTWSPRRSSRPRPPAVRDPLPGRQGRRLAGAGPQGTARPSLRRDDQHAVPLDRAQDLKPVEPRKSRSKVTTVAPTRWRRRRCRRRSRGWLSRTPPCTGPRTAP